MHQRAFITGVAGFAGGFLAEHLLACGDAVMGATPDGRWEANSSPTIRDSVQLVAWDLGSEKGPCIEALRRIEAFQPSAIYHLAALSVPDDCGKDAPLPAAMAVNVEGTRRVVQLAARLPSHPRLLLISSAKVYAPVEPADPVVDESSP
ncbi:MAG: NAD-dependent epimerase/dehydratase family protein, partial [Patescibacteria group bacterium]|nr:NAD-dependent epimerase/dehydratase family protein [Patescibacteria group bacterium]